MDQILYLAPLLLLVAVLDRLVVMRQAQAAAMEDLAQPLLYQAQVYLMLAVAAEDQEQVGPRVQLQLAVVREVPQQMQHREHLIPAVVAAAADGMARSATQVTVVLE